MQVPRRVKTAAFAGALLIHAGLVTVALWQAPDTASEASASGRIRVSIALVAQSGNTPLVTMGGMSGIREVAMAAPAEVNTITKIDQAVTGEAPVAISLEVGEVGKVMEAEPVTGSPVGELPLTSIAEHSPTVEIETVEIARASPAEPEIIATPPETAQSVVISDVIRVVEPTAGEAPLPVPTTRPVIRGVDEIQFEPVETVDLANPDTSAARPGASPTLARVRTSSTAVTSLEADQSVMPVPGSGMQAVEIGSPAAHESYLKEIRSRLIRFKRYPRAARRDGVVGEVTVRFTILADGSLQSPYLLVSSGDDRLDQAALRMLSRAQPFPPVPRGLGKDKLELSLPVEFSLSRGRSLF